VTLADRENLDRVEAVTTALKSVLKELETLRARPHDGLVRRANSQCEAKYLISVIGRP
jgi:hypothetical protein